MKTALSEISTVGAAFAEDVAAYVPTRLGATYGVCGSARRRANAWSSSVPQAQPRGLAAGKLAGEQQALRPGEQILGGEDELEPGRVGGERAEEEVVQSGVFAAADPVLDDGMGAIELFEPGDSAALLVGDEDLEAVAVVVGEGELGSGVRALPAADRPGTVRPAVRLQVEGELGDRRRLPLLARAGSARDANPARAQRGSPA